MSNEIENAVKEADDWLETHRRSEAWSVITRLRDTLVRVQDAQNARTEWAVDESWEGRGIVVYPTPSAAAAAFRTLYDLPTRRLLTREPGGEWRTVLPAEQDPRVVAVRNIGILRGGGHG